MYSFGWCRSIADAHLLHSSGFDYIECALNALKLEDDAVFKELLPQYLASPLPVRAFNLFCPADMRVVGPEVDFERIKRYAAKAGSALNRIGASVAVFGSGRARNVPDGWERVQAEDQLLQLFACIAEQFEGTGVTLAIEPLNRKETNIINSVGEAVTYAERINRPEIRVLADLYHMEEEREPIETIIHHRGWLAHIHIADSGRRSPGTGTYPYAAFAATLREAGYRGSISAECGVGDPAAEFPSSLAFMNHVFR